MDIIKWRFIFLILTFAVICVLCVFKRFKSGVYASTIGIFFTLIIWGIIEVYEKIKGYFTGVGMDFSEILSIVAYAFWAIIIFIVIVIFIEFSNRLKRRR